MQRNRREKEYKRRTNRRKCNKMKARCENNREKGCTKRANKGKDNKKSVDRLSKIEKERKITVRHKNIDSWKKIETENRDKEGNTQKIGKDNVCRNRENNHKSTE